MKQSIHTTFKIHREGGDDWTSCPLNSQNHTHKGVEDGGNERNYEIPLLPSHKAVNSCNVKKLYGAHNSLCKHFREQRFSQKQIQRGCLHPPLPALFEEK